MDKFRLDSHKLLYHIDRVHDWIVKGDVYPVYMEVSPSGACNHRCVFCALDFMGYKPTFLRTTPFCERIPELFGSGVRAIMFAGEGEPLLHRDIETIAETTFANGIDVAFTTNGTLLHTEKAERLLPVSRWIKISINGGKERTYRRLHRCSEGDYKKVLANLTAACEIKNRHHYSCTLGMQAILLPENSSEMKELARIARDIGLNYFVVKPYSQHPQSITDTYAKLSYKDCEKLKQELEEYNSDSFEVIFRNQSMQSWNTKEKTYQRCQALPFWSYIDSFGNVYGCSMFLGKDEMLYGNIYDSSFKQIWEGPKRKNSLQWVSESHDIRTCRINCRMDKINRYLWSLVHPPEHVNFI